MRRCAAMADLPPLTIARRFALWLLICTISAAPSFALALGAHADVAGMVAAVLTFALIYGALSCTAWFERVRRRPFARATMYVGYGLRLAMSLSMAGALLPNGGGGPFAYAIAPDMVCGLASLWLTRAAFGHGGNDFDVAESFVGAFATTCVQGAILNVIVFVVMAIAYGLQRAFRAPPAEQGPRGFDVVPVER